MDASEGPRAQSTRAFARNFSKLTDLADRAVGRAALHRRGRARTDRHGHEPRPPRRGDRRARRDLHPAGRARPAGKFARNALTKGPTPVPGEHDGLHRRGQIVEAVHDDRQPGRVEAVAEIAEQQADAKTPRRRRTSHIADAAPSTPATTAGWRRARRETIPTSRGRESRARKIPPRSGAATQNAITSSHSAPSARADFSTSPMKPGRDLAPERARQQIPALDQNASATAPMRKLLPGRPAQREVIGKRRARQADRDPERGSTAGNPMITESEIVRPPPTTWIAAAMSIGPSCRSTNQTTTAIWPTNIAPKMNRPHSAVPQNFQMRGGAGRGRSSGRIADRGSINWLSCRLASRRTARIRP